MAAGLLVDDDLVDECVEKHGDLWRMLYALERGSGGYESTDVERGDHATGGGAPGS